MPWVVLGVSLLFIGAGLSGTKNAVIGGVLPILGFLGVILSGFLFAAARVSAVQRSDAEMYTPTKEDLEIMKIKQIQRRGSPLAPQATGPGAPAAPAKDEPNAG